jgi:hypothetical protein
MAYDERIELAAFVHILAFSLILSSFTLSFPCFPNMTGYWREGYIISSFEMDE